MNFNPAMFGIDPKQLEGARQVGKILRLELRKCPREGRLEIKYIPIDPHDPRAQETVATCIENFAIQAAMIHDMLLGMKGKIIHES
jgi:hypothetical protein